MANKTPKIVSVYNQKGGTGKSTITMNLAAMAHEYKLKTIVIDIDDQATATRWYDNSPEDSPFPVYVTNASDKEKSLVAEIKQHVNNGYDLVIIDCPPTINKKAPRIALSVSDAVIIPTIPSPNDIWALDAALEMIDTEIKAINESLVVMIVGSMMAPRTNLSKEAMMELKKTDNVIVLDNYTTSRSIYRETPLQGKGVFHAKSATKEAKKEIKAVCDEILNNLFDQSCFQ